MYGRPRVVWGMLCITSYTMNPMFRTTISMPEDLAHMAQHEAQRRGVSVSAVVRQALEQHLYKYRGRKLPWQGIANRGTPAARDLDAELDRDWANDIVGDR